MKTQRRGLFSRSGGNCSWLHRGRSSIKVHYLCDNGSLLLHSHKLSMMVARLRPSTYIPIMMAFWGTAVSFMGIIWKPSQWNSLRFLLDLMESSFVAR